MALHQDCLSLARHDSVIKKLAAEDCTKFKPETDALIQIRTRDMFSAFYPLLKNFVGISEDISLSFTWDKSKSRFVPGASMIPLEEKNIFRNGSVPVGLLDAVPAAAGLWGLVNIPDMRPMTVENLKTYFLSKGELTGKPDVPVIYLYLGMEKEKISKTVLLLPAPDSGKEAQIKISELFNETGRYEVKFKFVCNGVLAISPSAEALTQIEESCAKKVPRFAQWSDNYLKALSGSVANSAFVNLGVLSTQSLIRGSAPEIQATTEYKQSLSLLSELPHFLWTGVKEEKSIMMKGINP